MASLQTRARALQKALKIPYQTAYNGLSKLGGLPARMADNVGWSISDCDLFYAEADFDRDAVDPNLDLGSDVVYIDVEHCSQCLGGKVFHGRDRKGIDSDSNSDLCYRCEQDAQPCDACGSPAIGGLCTSCQGAFDNAMSKD